MDHDNVYALFALRLRHLGSLADPMRELDRLMASVIMAPDAAAKMLLLDGCGREVLLGEGDEAFYKIVNKWNDVPAILAKAKEEGRLDPINARNIGYSAMQDAQIYAELLVDDKDMAESREAIKDGSHGLCSVTDEKHRADGARYYGLTLADIGKPKSYTPEEFGAAQRAKREKREANANTKPANIAGKE